MGLNKFLRILAKPIAGQRESSASTAKMVHNSFPDIGYPIGIYTVSRPLDGAPTKSYALTQPSSTVRSRGRERTKAALGISVQRDAVTLALARRLRVSCTRTPLELHHLNRMSCSTPSIVTACSANVRVVARMPRTAARTIGKSMSSRFGYVASNSDERYRLHDA